MTEYDNEFLQKFLEISKRLESKEEGKDMSMTDIYSAHSFRKLAESHPIQAIMSIHAKVCNLALAHNDASSHNRVGMSATQDNPQIDEVLGSREFKRLTVDLKILAKEVVRQNTDIKQLVEKNIGLNDKVVLLEQAIVSMQADIEDLKALTHKERLEAETNNFEIDL